MFFVTRCYDDVYSVDSGGGLEQLDGPAQDRLALQNRVLLGQGAAKSASSACGDDQGDTILHK